MGEKKEYNIGMAVLRIWMCFEVVIIHYRTWEGGIVDGILATFSNVAVPVFMLSAFVFSDMNKLVYDSECMKKRMFRLLIPHIFWTCIYFIIYMALDVKKGTDLIHSNMDFIWQLLFGHCINATVWFQIDLMLLTILFWFIFKVFKRENALIVTVLIGFVALCLQYMEIVAPVLGRIDWPETVFGEYFSSFYVIMPIGRIVEMIPYAVLGILICNFKILEKMKKYYNYILIGSVLLLFFFVKFDFFVRPVEGFQYQGAYLMVMGVLTFSLCYFLPLNMLPEFMKKLITAISKHTMAIYFMHKLIGTIFYNTSLSTWLNMSKGSMYDCILIFVCSYVIACLLGKIPVKWIRMSMQ